jgi:hypothetical protein
MSLDVSKKLAHGLSIFLVDSQVDSTAERSQMVGKHCPIAKKNIEAVGFKEAARYLSLLHGQVTRNRYQVSAHWTPPSLV